MAEMKRTSAYSCPCCGGHIGEAAPITEVLPVVAPLERRILDTLSRRVGQFVTGEQMTDSIYGMRADGGPDNPINVIRSAASRMNKKIAPFGWVVVGKGSSRGWGDCSLKLIPLEAGQ